VWSPTNSQSTLLGIINGAKTSLLVENEEMGDYPVIDALLAAAARGVSVEIAMENSKSYQLEFTALVQSGVKLAVYQHAKLYIHAKAIVADYGTSGAKVFVGSENFSSASLGFNRELGIVTTNAAILDGIQATLASDFAGGQTYVPPPDAGTPDAGDAGTGADADVDAADAGATDASDDGG
jgi:phosphatidylserine/phosphatidylglycerophosphate/cardiolipin synthase-like enzyme